MHCEISRTIVGQIHQYTIIYYVHCLLRFVCILTTSEYLSSDVADRFLVKVYEWNSSLLVHDVRMIS